ncbi:MAG: glycosyltransferase family 2 protein [Cycloclasticus sp.]|nr:glycosyltransferase family 2 protein [Cycloclasticus sp.]
MENNKSDPTISIIMPVYNGIGFLERSLPPLASMLQKGDVLELIVIDDGSLDQSMALAQEFGARVLESGGRKGPGAARNIAVEQAKGNIVWFVDADVVVKSDAVIKLKQGFENDEVVAVFGSYDDAPPAQNFLSQYKNMVHHYYHQQASRDASTFWSGCGAVRTKDFLELGGFDIEQFKHPSIEDIELGYRLRAAGGRITLMPELQCSHLKVWRFINLVHTEFFRRAIPWSRLMLRQKKLTNDLNVGVGERIRAVLAMSLVLVVLASLFGLLTWWFPVGVFIVGLIANSNFIGFFNRRKGFLFTCGGFLYHQFYYLYSSTAFAFAVLEKAVKK